MEYRTGDSGNDYVIYCHGEIRGGGKASITT